VAYVKLVDLSSKPPSSGIFLAFGDVMERLDVSLASVKPTRDDVRLVVEEYRAAARSVTTASREASALLAELKDANANAERNRREHQGIMDRMIAQCQRTRDEDCVRIARPMKMLGAGTFTVEQVERALAELGAVNPSDPVLRGGAAALVDNLREFGAFVRKTNELDERRRARSDELARATEGFSTLKVQASAACDKELNESARFSKLR
jgi:hypothetical protein